MEVLFFYKCTPVKSGFAPILAPIGGDEPFLVSAGRRGVLDSLGYGVGVEGPGEVLCDVDTKELGASDDLHSRASDVQWREVTSHSSEVQPSNNHLLSFVDI